MNKRTLSNDYLELEYLTDSLRITGLMPKGKANLFADLSARPPIPTPYGDFYFRGGHRLWHAPEAMPRTYIPDTRPLTIIDQKDGVVIEAQPEPGTGIRKRIEIRLAPDKPSVTLTHKLINDGLWPVELAVWAITQFRLGGVATLPIPKGNIDPDGLLPNRQFSFWPYTKLNDPRLTLADDFTHFHASARPPFKMGYLNQSGWLAYELEGVIFKKSFPVYPDSQHPDNNCNAEIYGCDEFVELESLSPLKKVNPGEAIEHLETWDILDIKVST